MGCKIKPLIGFQCKTIVVVTSDQDFRRRVQEKEGKEVPDVEGIMMKARFGLPDIEESSKSQPI